MATSFISHKKIDERVNETYINLMENLISLGHAEKLNGFMYPSTPAGIIVSYNVGFTNGDNDFDLQNYSSILLNHSKHSRKFKFSKFTQALCQFYTLN